MSLQIYTPTVSRCKTHCYSIVEPSDLPTVDHFWFVFCFRARNRQTVEPDHFWLLKSKIYMLASLGILKSKIYMPDGLRCKTNFVQCRGAVWVDHFWFVFCFTARKRQTEAACSIGNAKMSWTIDHFSILNSQIYKPDHFWILNFQIYIPNYFWCLNFQIYIPDHFWCLQFQRENFSLAAMNKLKN